MRQVQQNIRSHQYGRFDLHVGQWNTFEIRAEGSQIMVTLNGVITVDMDDDTFSDGPLTLQYGSGVVRFRNAKIQKL